MLYAFQHPDRFEAPEGLGGWLFMVCVTIATLGGSAVAILSVHKDRELLSHD